MTEDEFRRLMLSFPGVEDGVTHSEASYKIEGKFFTWLRPALDHSVVVHLDNRDERDLLIEMDPDAFHFTDHYRDYPIVLARLAAVDPEWLRARLTQRWRKVATRKLQKQHPELSEAGSGA